MSLESAVFRLPALAFLLSLAVPAAGMADQNTPTGRWITANGQAVVQIFPCGGDLCGDIVGIALAHPGDKMPSDWRGQPQCGLTIIETAPATAADGSQMWEGSVLDPRNGNVYHAQIKLDSNRHLLLHGYLGLPIFGQTQTWLPYSGRTLSNCHLAAIPNLSSASG
jgi:uncharacterized protein (DUF2147 family)